MKFTIFLYLVGLVAASFAASLAGNYSRTRIIGGQLAQKGQFPYQASIYVRGKHCCGGSILTENHILTAAHCIFKNERLVIHVGRLTHNDGSTDVQVIDTARAVQHPDWGKTKFGADIAVIRLAKPITFFATIKPIQLAESDECEQLQTSTVSGWGLEEGLIPARTLRHVSLPRISIQECDQRLGLYLKPPIPLEDRKMLCVASASSHYQGTCAGDSGGPLVLHSSKRQIGVVSWGLTKCGDFPRAPSVLTNVCHYKMWVQQQVTIL